jgi:hypothetical protein
VSPARAAAQHLREQRSDAGEIEAGHAEPERARGAAGRDLVVAARDQRGQHDLHEARTPAAAEDAVARALGDRLEQHQLVPVEADAAHRDHAQRDEREARERGERDEQPAGLARAHRCASSAGARRGFR